MLCVMPSDDYIIISFQHIPHFTRYFDFTRKLTINITWRIMLCVHFTQTLKKNVNKFNSIKALHIQPGLRVVNALALIILN